MIKKYTETKLVKDIVTVKSEIYCDKCNKLLYTEYPRIGLNGKRRKEVPHKIDIYEVTTGHNDWGNDSVDSIDSFHSCSDCLPDVINDYILRSKERNNTEYIDISHTHYDTQYAIDEEE